MRYSSLSFAVLLMICCAFMLSSCGARIVNNSVSTHKPMHDAQWSDMNTYAIDETKGTKLNNIGIGRQYNQHLHHGHFWGGGATFINRHEKDPEKGVVNKLSMGGFATGGVRAGKLSAHLTASGNQDEYAISATLSFRLGLSVRSLFNLP